MNKEKANIRKSFASEIVDCYTSEGMTGPRAGEILVTLLLSKAEINPPFKYRGLPIRNGFKAGGWRDYFWDMVDQHDMNELESFCEDFIERHIHTALNHDSRTEVQSSRHFVQHLLGGGDLMNLADDRTWEWLTDLFGYPRSSLGVQLWYEVTTGKQRYHFRRRLTMNIPQDVLDEHGVEKIFAHPHFDHVMCIKMAYQKPKIFLVANKPSELIDGDTGKRHEGYVLVKERDFFAYAGPERLLAEIIERSMAE